MKLYLSLFILIAFQSSFTYGVDSHTINYIDKYAYLAIEEMERTGVPASITLAQGIAESNSGRSDLATIANNHFGIKCKEHWTGGTYFQKDDDRNSSGKLIKSCFRSYSSDIDSYVDHSNFLKTRPYYKALFDLDIMDYKGWAHGLKKAGYATDPNYAYKLIKIIERNQLYHYDIQDFGVNKNKPISNFNPPAVQKQKPVKKTITQPREEIIKKSDGTKVRRIIIGNPRGVE